MQVFGHGNVAVVVVVAGATVVSCSGVSLYKRKQQQRIAEKLESESMPPSWTDAIVLMISGVTQLPTMSSVGADNKLMTNEASRMLPFWLTRFCRLLRVHLRPAAFLRCCSTTTQTSQTQLRRLRFTFICESLNH